MLIKRDQTFMKSAERDVAGRDADDDDKVSSGAVSKAANVIRAPSKSEALRQMQSSHAIQLREIISTMRAWRKKERTKSLTKRACDGHRVRMGIQSFMGQGYEGEVSGVRIVSTRHPHRYVMAVLSGARVVHVLCACVVAPCVCVGDASECAQWWLTPPSRAFTKRFLFLTMPK